MKHQIDRKRLSELDKDSPPSPRNRKITTLGVISLAFYLVAAFCAWQIGGWWGIGLVTSLFAASTLDDFVHEEHRQELVELHGTLVKEIAKNSEILMKKVPTKERNASDENSP